jgi:hypothetical protein
MIFSWTQLSPWGFFICMNSCPVHDYRKVEAQTYKEVLIWCYTLSMTWLAWATPHTSRLVISFILPSSFFSRHPVLQRSGYHGYRMRRLRPQDEWSQIRRRYCAQGEEDHFEAHWPRAWPNEGRPQGKGPNTRTDAQYTRYGSGGGGAGNQSAPFCSGNVWEQKGTFFFASSPSNQKLFAFNREKRWLDQEGVPALGGGWVM